MDTRLNKAIAGFISLLLLFSFLFNACSCDGPEPDQFVPMIFNVPISVTPPGPEIHIGDTLWLELDQPDTLLEYYSNEYFQLVNFDFKMTVNMFKLVDPTTYISYQEGAFSKFAIVNKEGGILDLRESFGDMYTAYRESRYHLKTAIVPKETGVFSLSLLWPIDLHNLPREQIDLRPFITLKRARNGAKRYPAYDAFFFIVNNGNTNYDLFKENCKTGSFENPDQFRDLYFEQKCRYTFRVVE